MQKQEQKIKIITSNLPVVVLFGRTNVGKSTLFNKLTGKANALVSSAAGTTRDVNRATVEWQGATFQLVDTGGVGEEGGAVVEVAALQGPPRDAGHPQWGQPAGLGADQEVG